VRARRESEGIERNTFTGVGGPNRKVPDLKVPRQCPLFLLVQVGWAKCTVLNSKEG
jgi:hypothetical protein